MATFLIVDDEPAMLDVVGMVLTTAGHQAVKATSLLEAQAVLEKNSVDSAIVDVWLGQDDGLTLCRDLNARGLPFMVMSGGGKGKSLETVTARADALGAHAMLFKPFDDEELLKAADEIVSA